MHVYYMSVPVYECLNGCRYVYVCAVGLDGERERNMSTMKVGAVGAGVMAQ